ncbi:protein STRICTOSIDINE SYNTHASE-LIKE 5-like [Tripterygium wilfordii]|uniref:Protein STRICTOSIDINE SYNTHASE-LIKE 5-like n=2 Tax=Tripterygium wilfordii TaxID=458696 RepID=A0A7J7E4A6_TRIWF|nr:protein STRICTOSIDINE SYNTHASE-LIKE 5-like [Tripterygium wilfordii]
MANGVAVQERSFPPPPPPNRRTSSCTFYSFLFSLLLPITASILLYHLDSFDPAPYPLPDHTQPPLKALTKNDRILHGSDRVGVGRLQAPEDLAYDAKLGVIYTGCGDGWIKRVRFNESVSDSVIDDLVNTGGRPLGIAIGHYHELIVADTYKGLLNITSSDGSVQVLTQEAEGVKFKLTDGVGVANDGMIYFTDASYKYNFHEFIWDILEGKPHGRLMSYDPATKETKVLLKDLYFANGIAVSPDQTFVVYCETPLRRCSKYYIHGEKKGSVDDFSPNLPGYPDNIHFDGQGRAWIAFSTEKTLLWDLTIRYPVIRKVTGIVEKYVGTPFIGKNGGVLVVDSEGKPCEHYYDPGLTLISSGIKIGDHLYCGSINNPYIVRLDLSKYPALPAYEQ